MLTRRALLGMWVASALPYSVPTVRGGALDKVDIKLDVAAVLELIIRTVREAINSTSEQRREKGKKAAATIVQAMLVMAAAADRLAADFEQTTDGNLSDNAFVLDAIGKYRDVAEPALRAAERAVQDLDPAFTLANVSVMDGTTAVLGFRSAVLRSLREFTDHAKRLAKDNPNKFVFEHSNLIQWSETLHKLAEWLRDAAHKLGKASSA